LISATIERYLDRLDSATRCRIYRHFYSSHGLIQCCWVSENLREFWRQLYISSHH